MANKIKTMGRLEYMIGVVYGAILSSYIVPGINPPVAVVAVALLFTATYFSHWAFTLIERYVDHKLLIQHLEIKKNESTEQRPERFVP